MHGGLYVEMASFFVSRIVAGIRSNGALNAPGFIRCNSSSCWHQAGFERWVDGRNSIVMIPDPFGTDMGGQKDVR